MTLTLMTNEAVSEDKPIPLPTLTTNKGPVECIYGGGYMVEVSIVADCGYTAQCGEVCHLVPACSGE